jgi:hypothetical protein
MITDLFFPLGALVMTLLTIPVMRRLRAKAIKNTSSDRSVVPAEVREDGAVLKEIRLAFERVQADLEAKISAMQHTQVQLERELSKQFAKQISLAVREARETQLQVHSELSRNIAHLADRLERMTVRVAPQVILANPPWSVPSDLTTTGGPYEFVSPHEIVNVFAAQSTRVTVTKIQQEEPSSVAEVFKKAPD